jgi:hypothetical protein
VLATLLSPEPAQEKMRSKCNYQSGCIHRHFAGYCQGVISQFKH